MGARSRCRGSATAAFAVALAAFAWAAAVRAQDAQREEAVEWARAGELERAIPRLQELRLAYPGDVPVAADLAVILQWAGRDRDMLEVFETIGPDAAPGYALFAAARSARALGDFDRAEVYLRRGATRFPEERRWAVLQALVYADAGRLEDARRALVASYGTDPSDLEALLAWGYLSARARDMPAALRYYTEVLKLRPGNHEALGGRVMALEALGAPFRAEELGRTPADLLDPPERDRVAETRSAMLLRWGRLDAEDPARRYEATDRSIADLERRIAEMEARPDAAHALQRARFDLLVAYRDRSRMRDAVAVYERLRGEGIRVPAYSRLSAASAYLYLENPETARELYQSVIDEGPADAEVRFEARLGLFYAWVELERYDRAYEVIDALDREQPAFVKYLDSGATIENESKSTAAVAAALARYYGGQLGEAWDRLSPLAARAPAARWLQADLASLARARGWPRRSLELVEPWARTEPNNVGLQLGRAASLLELRRYPEAGPVIEELYRVYPEHKGVAELKRDWDVHRMWEWITRVEPSYGAEPQAENVPGLMVMTRLWSPPLADHWRASAAYRYATEDLEEGRETFHRAAAGLEYRGPSLRAFAELTYNESTEDGLGGRVEVEWTPTDHVSLSAAGEIFSQETPLRALKHGVTADALELGARYRFHESRALGVTWRLMDFDDGNVRHELFPRFAQRLLDRPRFTVTAEVELYYSTNSRTDVVYFSPEWLFTPTVSLIGEHVAWRRYRRSLVHALTATIGGTWQAGFDGEPIGSIAYEHRWQLGRQVGLSYGILLGSRMFDGDREQQILGYLQLTVRF